MGALSCGWNTDARGDHFSLRFNPCTRDPLAWKEELYAAARSLANQTDKPIWLCSSGGIDSEIMCRAFFDQGIHFSVLTLQYDRGGNEHDTRYVDAWCRERAITQKKVIVDLREIATNPSYDQYRIGRSHAIFRRVQVRLLELVEAMQGFAVLGWGEPLYRVGENVATPSIGDVYMDFEPGYSVPYEWMDAHHTSHEPYFFFSTPELCLSYIRVPIVAHMLSRPDIFRHEANAHDFKRLVYQSFWPDIEPRYKYHGLEHYIDLVHAVADRTQTYSEYAQRLTIPELIGQLEGGHGD